ncbi:VOC family protein [Chiayiivirga flava]|uniref:Putative enzyme related to lactoylglutathione lyase n=1 Tax=Chiayiivirga flava TaxID=659595 RepID=A0A7W8G0H8_9GAMM|nr:VOC family protein [Chiayiivirga flava]MBB5209196.1 putative enzyme related to lactoylglutathione lyase [Chiayiivirga flava]
MAHRSRLAGFIIDCNTDSLDDAAAFWSAALGTSVADPNEGGDGKYAVLGDTPAALHIEVQRVDHPSRVHLDIETDDIDAEVTRLVALGAKEVSRPHNARWVVLEAPTGQRFCVIRMRNADAGPALNAWD